jgi:hypothetical protein
MQQTCRSGGLGGLSYSRSRLSVERVMTPAGTAFGARNPCKMAPEVDALQLGVPALD